MYDAHTKGGGQAQMDARGWWEGSAQLHVNVHTESFLPLMQRTSNFYQNFIFGCSKKWTFFVNINY